MVRPLCDPVPYATRRTPTALTSGPRHSPVGGACRDRVSVGDEWNHQVLAALSSDEEAMVASTKKPTREWTAMDATRAAREARIATVEFFRGAPIARSWQASKLLLLNSSNMGRATGRQVSCDLPSAITELASLAGVPPCNGSAYNGV